MHGKTSATVDLLTSFTQKLQARRGRFSARSILPFLKQIVDMDAEAMRSALLAVTRRLDEERNARLDKEKRRAKSMASEIVELVDRVFAIRPDEFWPVTTFGSLKTDKALAMYWGRDFVHGGYGDSQEEVMVSAIRHAPNLLLIVKKVPWQWKRDMPTILWCRSGFVVFGKDIGSPAYEKVSRPEGFAIVLTAAGKRAAAGAGSVAGMVKLDK